jgi:hypothetical protein
MAGRPGMGQQSVKDGGSASWRRRRQVANQPFPGAPLRGGVRYAAKERV